MDARSTPLCKEDAIASNSVIVQRGGTTAAAYSVVLLDETARQTALQAATDRVERTDNDDHMIASQTRKVNETCTYSSNIAGQQVSFPRTRGCSHPGQDHADGHWVISAHAGLFR